MAPPPPRLVIFDMDDVLVRYDPDVRRAAMGALAGLSAGDVERLIWDSGIEDAADMGALSSDGYLGAVSHALGVPFGRRQWLETRRVAMRLDPDTPALARRVGERARLALLTNNGYLMREHFDALVPELRAIFGAAMHVAAEFGTKKPDPDIYRRLAALHGAAPHEAMMIDDKPGHVAGARSAGLEGHVFTGLEGLRERLQALRLV
ncbi:HAD-IA family hydrolase [Starkeya sp. ORNL1]|uniref:HAD-IA family hydrolase n=1 Tax=Starkeya sp. ORNL1 TaxID=2709380 RepID=UPI001462E803|nr:HAD-IA family hydrolase [Starkeya sp. ORNL1]QJP14392.1 HAD-IA family hydrolase [Starkeya sp. ORNL1]